MRSLQSPSRELTGRFLIDDNFLAENGVTDFDRYRVDPTQALGAGLLRAGRYPAAGMIPKSMPLDLIRGWSPVFGLDHAHVAS